MAQLALARAEIDRAEHLRDDETWWDSVQHRLSTQFLVVHRGQALTKRTTSGMGLVFHPADHVPRVGVRVLLGVGSDEQAYVGVLLNDDDLRPEAADDQQWMGLRECGAELEARDAGLFVAAAALANWHRAHPMCPRCGVASKPHQAGWSRKCPQDESQHFPRSDPAVIVLVTDDADRALLGRRVDWEQGFFSTFAGFVEAGESAEMTVHRELFEEAGVHVDSLSYLGSQPWPFPASLMLGYRARLAAGSPAARPDGSEIIEVRWFSREELAAGCADGSVRVPPAVSIARRLIEDWFGAELNGSWSRP